MLLNYYSGIRGLPFPQAPGKYYRSENGPNIGVEIFGGYRMNIGNRLPAGVTPVRTSGLAASIDIYILPPFSARKK